MSTEDVRAHHDTDVRVQDGAGLRVEDETVAVPSGRFWPDGSVDALRERWRELQLSGSRADHVSRRREVVVSRDGAAARDGENALDRHQERLGQLPPRGT